MPRRRRFLREPRSGGIPVATGVSPWNRIRSKTERRRRDTIRLESGLLFIALGNVTTKRVSPLRGSGRKRLRRSISCLQMSKLQSRYAAKKHNENKILVAAGYESNREKLN